MSKETLINELSPSITTKVNAFLNVLSVEEVEFQKEIDALEQKMNSETLPTIKAAWKTVLKEKKEGRPDSSGARRHDAALALLHIANTLKLPLQLKTETAKIAKVKGEKQGRMTKVEADKLASDVHAILKDKKSAAIGALALETKSDVKAVRSMLIRLQRDGLVKSGGKGKGSEWIFVK